eukprot:14688576-Alexandrium_andersonii.AAC.1
MSASLVGSEMCIRDSRRVRKRLRGPEYLGCRSDRRHSEDKPPTIRSAAAVSYTHLTLPTICSV